MGFIDKLVEHFIKLNKKMKRWQRLISVMAAVVVFATTYALILPAITLDRDTAEAMPGIEVAAGDNNANESGTVFEEAELEKTVQETEESGEQAVEEPAAEETEQSGDGSAQSNAEEEDSAGESNEAVKPTDDDEDNTDSVIAATTEAADSSTVAAPEEAASEIVAATNQAAENASAEGTTQERPLITEDTQLIYKGADYTVYAEFGESARLPMGVKLSVREITRESDPKAYEEYYNKALNELQGKYDENSTLSFARFYDITFKYEEKEIEPSGDVKVRIEYKKAVEVQSETIVDAVHFNKEENEKAEVLDSETNGSDTALKSVEFESDRFSVYGVVGLETLETDVLASDGNRYRITASFDADARIPKGARLVANEIEEGSQAYQNAFDKAQEYIGQKLTYGRFFDISIEKDGKKIVPEAPVEITISVDDTVAVAKGTDLKAIHFGTDGPELLKATTSGTDYDVILDVSEMCFSTESFSTFGSVGAAAYKAVPLAAKANANIETNVEVNVSGVDGQSKLTIRTGKLNETDNPSIKIDGYKFKEAWYKEIPIDGLYFDGEVFYGTIDGNRITGVEIDPDDVTLYYDEGNYAVNYVVTVGGETESDYSKMLELKGPVGVDAGGYIEFYAMPKAGYIISSMTASNGEITQLPRDGYYRLSDVTSDSTITVNLTELTRYEFSFAGSNTIITFNGTTRNSGQGLTTNYTAANAINFSLDGYDQWGSTGTYALNKLSVSIGGESISANIPDTQGATAVTNTNSGYTITVTRGATHSKQGQRGTCYFPVYEVSITAPDGEKVRGDIALDTNYKVTSSSEVVAKQLDGVEPLAYYGYKGSSTSGSYTNSDTAAGDENKRLSDVIFSKYPRDQGRNGRGKTSNSHYYVKLDGTYSAEDLYLTVVDYNAASNTFIDVISETKVSSLPHINSNMIYALNRDGASVYTTDDYMFTIGPDSSYSRALTDVRIYIVYKPHPDQEYTVSYDLDGGTADPMPTDDGRYVKDGTPVTIAVSLPTKEGKVFQGWYLEGNPDVVYRSRELFSITDDTVRYANADHEFVFKAKWADQKTADFAPYTVNVYLQNEDGTYDDGSEGREDIPYIVNIEHGEVGTTAYVIRTELEAWLTEIQPTWDEKYEYDKEVLDRIVREGSSVVKIYYKLIRKKGNIQVVKHFDVQDMYLDGQGLDYYRNELMITVTGPVQEDGQPYSKTIPLSEFTFDGDHTYKWQDYQILVGEYQVQESGEQDLLPGYDLQEPHVKETDITVTERAAAGGFSEGTPLENHYRGEKGTLTVRKSVTGVEANDKQYKFTIKNNDLKYLDEDKVEHTGMYVKDETAQHFTSKESEAYEFTITNGGTVSKDLPAGSYTVTELYTGEGEDAQIENYTLSVSYSANPVTVTREEETETTITNAYTRITSEVTITKTFTGIEPDDIPTDFGIRNSYNDTILGIESAETVSPDRLTYVWKMSGMPVGEEIEFTEQNYEAPGYKWLGNETTDLSRKITIIKDSSINTVEFANNYELSKVNLKLFKYDATEVTKGLHAGFSLYKEEDVQDGKPKEGATPAATFTTDASGDSDTAELNAGTYYLFETDTPEGYNTMEYPWVIMIDPAQSSSSGVVTVTENGSAKPGVVDVETEDSSESGSGSESDAVIVYKVKVPNNPGVELPNSGGPGTYFYTLGGLMLIIISALLYGFRMRRRERRLK